MTSKEKIHFNYRHPEEGTFTLCGAEARRAHRVALLSEVTCPECLHEMQILKSVHRQNGLFNATLCGRERKGRFAGIQIVKSDKADGPRVSCPECLIKMRSRVNMREAEKGRQRRDDHAALYNLVQRGQQFADLLDAAGNTEKAEQVREECRSVCRSVCRSGALQRVLKQE